MTDRLPVFQSIEWLPAIKLSRSVGNICYNRSSAHLIGYPKMASKSGFPIEWSVMREISVIDICCR